MEYYGGGNLQQYVRDHHPLAFADVRRFFSGILKGVHAMSARGFSHRDIKPENVLLSEGGEVVLVDLGLCAKTTPGETVKEIVGTPGYALLFLVCVNLECALL